MRWSQSLRARLALLVVTTAVGASLLSAVAVVSYELVIRRQALNREVLLRGEIATQHGAAALAFDDPTSAEKILGALDVRESSVAAAVIALLSCCLACCLALPIALRLQRRMSEGELERCREELEQRVKARTRELVRFQERLRDSERLASVGILTAGIAHQINNPVGAILSASEFALLCEEDANAHEVWKQALTRCADEARRCGRIVRSVQHFSRGEQSERWTEDVSKVVGQACRLTASYAQRLGGAVDFQPSDAPTPVLMNPIEMEQVFVNLIRNGLESRVGGARVEIRVGSSEDRVSVEIRDNGRGMDAEQISHVFDPFSTTRLSDGGAGLGLSMSHGIVVSHGGSISVESGRSGGTTFRVELPL